jgi:hypothetical protein
MRIHPQGCRALMARRLPLPETNDSEGPMRALLTALLFAASPAFAALEARDINRDGNVDAYFDTTQNLTWLDMASDGWWFAFSQSEAQSMVAGLAVLGFDDWRLPEGLGIRSSRLSEMPPSGRPRQGASR